MANASKAPGSSGERAVIICLSILPKDRARAMTPSPYVLDFADISLADVPKVWTRAGVQSGIDSISLNPGVALATTLRVAAAEATIATAR